MLEQKIQVINALGIHARPASKIVQTANRFKCKIELIREGANADAKSILHVIMLGASFGSTILVRVSGENEKEALDAIAQLFAGKFDED